MSFENPTRLRIGMRGDLAGKDFKVVGRVVMGVTDDGETYYWDEFNLESSDGTSADLVFEQTERGGEWRLFIMFEPEYPMTAADAATRRAGDRLNLNGTDVRVALVDSSRVYFIEGKAADGVEVGDVANYFNAEAGTVMQVVSWTGDEVEYYNGLTLSRGEVEAAFKLPQPSTAKIFSGLDHRSALSGTDSEEYWSGIKFFLISTVAVATLAFLILGQNLSCSASHASRPAKKTFAASPPLILGATGRWNEKNFRITAHATIEIGEMGAVFERNEYELADDDGHVSLLVCGDKPKSKDWILFTPLDPLVPPTAQRSAAQKAGDTVNIDGVTASIRELFQSTVSLTENVAPSDWHVGDVYFGYLGQSEYGLLLARWNNSRIAFYRGKNIPAKDVTAAFAVPNAR
ncbi:MAG TPA: DUF4178 domain-containing protein [Verrucomicrobiae bacterium]|nr:DUF4178 domain-containing protein [Verrucomicrobiae bacterium]